MDLSGFVLKMLWGAIKGKIAPNMKDAATALALTLIFGLSCSWQPLGYAVFFVLSLAIIYLLTRMVLAVKVLLQLKKMRDGMAGAAQAISGLVKK